MFKYLPFAIAILGSSPVYAGSEWSNFSFSNTGQFISNFQRNNISESVVRTGRITIGGRHYYYVPGKGSTRGLNPAGSDPYGVDCCERPSNKN